MFLVGSGLLVLGGLTATLGVLADLISANRKLLDELIPDKVQIDVLHQVLRLLLEEQVSIRNLPLILEAIAEMRGQQVQPETICEHVRQRLGFQLVAGLRRTDGTIPLIQLAPEWEDTLSTYQVEGARGGLDVTLPPEMFESLKIAGLHSARVKTVADRRDKSHTLLSPSRTKYPEPHYSLRWRQSLVVVVHSLVSLLDSIAGLTGHWSRISATQARVRVHHHSGRSFGSS